MGELKAVSEDVGEAVKLELTVLRELDARVLDLVDDGVELPDGGDELLGARPAEAGLS